MGGTHQLYCVSDCRWVEHISCIVSDCRWVEHISCIVSVTAGGWTKQNKYPACFLTFGVGLSASLVGSSLAKN